MAAPRGVKRKVAERSGCDMEGHPCRSSRELWAAELPDREHGAVVGDGVENDVYEPISSAGGIEVGPPHVSPWYAKSCSYWQKQEATVRGMLGGMDDLHDRDIRGSRSFLDKLVVRHGLQIGANAVALDIGAGIGRITKALLLPMFGVVDMLEQNEEYLLKSEQFLKSLPDIPRIGIVQNRIPCGMQGFSVEDPVTGLSTRGRYNLIWIQWCIIYLTDEDFVSFLKTCFECLAPGGIVCVKDNTAPRGPNSFVLDKEDSSVMRSIAYMKDLFLQAGAHCIAEHTHRDFPSNTFPVRTWALIENTKAAADGAPTTGSARMTRQSAGTSATKVR
jgi:protein N-terminal methyltransferase